MPKIAGRAAPIPGYRMEEINWKLQTESGTTVNVTGTIQEVMQYAEKNNIALKLDNQNQQSKEANSPYSDLQCGVWGDADEHYIKEGIEYLRNINKDGRENKPSLGPGPVCGRVSCSHSSAIYWCNKVRKVQLDTCFHIIPHPRLPLGFDGIFYLYT